MKVYYKYFFFFLLTMLTYFHLSNFHFGFLILIRMTLKICVSHFVCSSSYTDVCMYAQKFPSSVSSYLCSDTEVIFKTF